MGRLGIFSALVVPLALAACGGTPADDQARQSGQQLEQAATDRGLFGQDWAEPVGIFERRNGDGRDRLCVTQQRSPSGDMAASGGPWRFAFEVKAKDGGTCLTGGEIAVGEGTEKDGAPAGTEPSKRPWTLRFQGLDNCTVTATEQGDQLIFPAHLPASCSALCAGRVDLAGAELDRTSWSEEEAQILRLRRADGRMKAACAAGE